MKKFEAGIFDLDGVITRTTGLHQKAWRALFEEYRRFLLRNGKAAFAPYQDADYAAYIDGRSRLDGLKAFLQSRDLQLPTGDPGDRLEDETLYGLGNFKNEAFRQRLRSEGVDLYPDAVDRIRAWRAKGLKTAVISASKNCALILERTGLEDLFDTRIDGQIAEERGLPGKPDPAIMLEAARELGVRPPKAFVVEDALPGVAAAAEGGFGLVVGLVRNAAAEELREHGADIVLSRLGQLNPESAVDIMPEELPNALDHREEIRHILEKRRPLLFLDFDGTLAPIVNDHKKAGIDPQIRQTLEKMTPHFMLVAIVSGRDLLDVKNRVGIDHLYYLGSHGFEASGPGNFSERQPEAIGLLPQLQEAEKEARERLKDYEGTDVERKGFAIALHYRQAGEDGEKAVRETVRKITERRPGLKMSSGKMVVEIRPDIEWDKGKAISWLMDKTKVKKAERTPIYIGDDLTDEDAYREIRDTGIGIQVGRHGEPTAARYFLRDVPEVRKFLQWILEMEMEVDQKIKKQA
jgi:alpha,alpha-trehalase